MMTLKKFETNNHGGFTAAFDVKHSSEGPEGTTLTASLRMDYVEGRAESTITVGECFGVTPKDSLDRMAAWLRRLAQGIDERKEVRLPVA